MTSFVNSAISITHSWYNYCIAGCCEWLSGSTVVQMFSNTVAWEHREFHIGNSNHGNKQQGNLLVAIDKN